MKTKNQKKLSLALQGGGAHGAFTWGVLDKFLESDIITIDSISATSAGAMNAAVLAEGYRKGGREGARHALRKFWELVNKTTMPEFVFRSDYTTILSYYFFETLTRMFSPYLLNPANINPLKDILLELIDFKQLRKYQEIKLFICATNVKTCSPKIFAGPELSEDVLLASACIPSYFQAVKIGDDYYWDGGYIGNPAIYPLIYHTDTKDILIVHINPINREQLPITSLEILNRMNEISFNTGLIRELRAMAFINSLIDTKAISAKHKNKIRKIYAHSLRTDAIMSSFDIITKWDGEWDFFMHLFELGYQAADNWIKEHFDHIGTLQTIDFDEFK